jgi:hypothetical protein
MQGPAYRPAYQTSRILDNQMTAGPPIATRPTCGTGEAAIQASGGSMNQQSLNRQPK